MVEKTALTEQELEKKIKEMAPKWKTGKNEKEVSFIQRVYHASKFMEGIDFVQKVAKKLLKRTITTQISSSITNGFPSVIGHIQQAV